MKKTILFLGVLAVVLLMISSATAVPQTQGKEVMNVMDTAEQKIRAGYTSFFKISKDDFNINTVKDLFAEMFDDGEPTYTTIGLIGLIIRIIQEIFAIVISKIGGIAEVVIDGLIAIGGLIIYIPLAVAFGILAILCSIYDAIDDKLEEILEWLRDINP